MAKSSRQTFRKRQREIDKKKKKEDKAKRLAARREGEKPGDGDRVDKSGSDASGEGKTTLKITPVGGSYTESEEK